MDRADSLLEPVLRRLGIGDGVRLARLRGAWGTLFDETLSRHMWPFRLTEGELLINTVSPVWIQQLTFCSRDILAKLAPFGVRTVRFRIGHIGGAQQQKKEEGPAPRLTAEDSRFLDELVSGMKDDGLRSAVRAAAERSLSRRRRG